MVFRQTQSKYTWSLYLRFCFNITAISPSETASICKLSNIFAASRETLEIPFLILEDLPFP